ncbi:MAG: methyltransferase domain-containing protein [Myxococcota bacterium]
MADFAYRTRPLTFAEGPLRLELELLEAFESESARLYAHRGRQGLPADPDLSPMFGVIWPSARVATRYVARADLAGKRVLEIGCGLGLPSLLAAVRGARVRATDNHPDAGPFLAANARRNGVELEFAPLDVRTCPPDRTWDLVLATDVLFAVDMPAAIARAFEHHLAPDGVGLLVDPGRAWSDRVVEEAEARGLTVDIDVEEADGHELFALTLRRRLEGRGTDGP